MVVLLKVVYTTDVTSVISTAYVPVIIRSCNCMSQLLLCFLPTHGFHIETMSSSIGIGIIVARLQCDLAVDEVIAGVRSFQEFTRIGKRNARM